MTNSPPHGDFPVLEHFQRSEIPRQAAMRRTRPEMNCTGLSAAPVKMIYYTPKVPLCARREYTAAICTPSEMYRLDAVTNSPSHGEFSRVGTLSAVSTSRQAAMRSTRSEMSCTSLFTELVKMIGHTPEVPLCTHREYTAAIFTTSEMYRLDAVTNSPSHGEFSRVGTLSAVGDSPSSGNASHTP